MCEVARRKTKRKIGRHASGSKMDRSIESNLCVKLKNDDVQTKGGFLRDLGPLERLASRREGKLSCVPLLSCASPL
jgi:hypothetical protein